MNKRYEIAIVGGTGGMGQVLVRELKTHADILIISRSLEKAKKNAETFGVRGGILKDCNTADITIVSVPVEYTHDTCQKLLKILKSGSLLIDISAVKTFIEDLKPDIPENISYISMHPLFGPEGSFQDFNVILIPVKDDKWLPIIQKLLSELGALTVIATSEEHDRIMSKIQVAHHFIYLMLASYLSDSQISPKFFTRSFRKTLQNFIGIEKNLDAILEIQKLNPHAQTTRKEFVSLMEKFISLDHEKNMKELLGNIQTFKEKYLL
ncbi:MAG: prephenate dehydrogenase/arogenate dehydrogenase family protein [Candidatus Helarchaeota archaeon]|nr:prephenate dehydrogenase/arogenate dehydrogenase family protein [Candidatus Helarchaeota archaeon]